MSEYSYILIENNSTGVKEKVSLQRWEDILKYYGEDKYTILSYLDEKGNDVDVEILKRPISDNKLNKVVNVTLTGGIIGLIGNSPQNSLNRQISKENANGWKVIQIIPSESGNILLIILRLLLLICTLFFYTTANGYYVIMEKKEEE